MEIVRDDAENIFDFLDRWASFDGNVVICNALTSYTTEANYRFTLARLIESGSGCAAIIEDRKNKRVPLIYRAARTLGIDGAITSFVNGDRLVLVFRRGLENFDLHAWRRDPAPFLLRPDIPRVVGLVVRAIEKGRPLSLVRVGHCEVRFAAHGLAYGDSDVAKSCQIQWGGVPEAWFLDKVKRDLHEAIRGASILGFKGREKFGSRSLAILDNSVLRCLSDLGLLQSGQIQTSPNIHFSLGESRAFISVLKWVPNIIIISPRRAAYEKVARFCSAATDVWWIPLPGEARVDGVSDIRERVQRFVQIESELAALVRPGSVVLVGAGVAGKIYCELARWRGAIGLDLGSTLDAWAGIDSRGSGFPDRLKYAWDRNQ